MANRAEMIKDLVSRLKTNRDQIKSLVLAVEYFAIDPNCPAAESCANIAITVRSGDDSKLTITDLLRDQAAMLFRLEELTNQLR